MSSEKKTVAEQLISGLTDLADSLDNNKGLGEKFTISKLTLDLEPNYDYTSDDVKAIRVSLRVSQAIFAKLLNVSTQTVQAWEQDRNPVTGSAVRVLQDMQERPEHWKGLLVRRTTNSGQGTVNT